MPGLHLLQSLLLILAIAVVVVALLQRLRIPPIAAFIVAGGLVGPHGLGIVSDATEVDLLAEIGINLLLFGIGLELSVDRMHRLWRAILAGGFLQVAATSTLAFAVARWLGVPVRSAIFLGFLLALSSTAIVLRGLQRRGEVDAPHGQFTLGILIFQDLAVIPMILVLPLLAGEADATSLVVSWLAIGKAVALVAVTFVGARFLVPRVLHWVSGTRQRDLFVLAVLVVCGGIVWLVANAGVSPALGAFLAGLVVSGTPYRHQALADVIPFREVFTSLFFVSIGMLLDVGGLTREAGFVAALLAAIVGGKFLVTVAVGALLRFPLRVSVLTGAALAQVGEFAFVLLHAARGTDLIPELLQAHLMAAIILSMVLTPFLLVLGPGIAAGAGRMRSLTRLLGVRTPADDTQKLLPLQGHVIIAGYGVAGQELAQSLKSCEIDYVIVDLNPESVRRATESGEPAFFGDITAPEILEHLGAGRAHELVLTINDPRAAERAVRFARGRYPALPILVRSQYLGDLADLIAAGATEVVPAELEAAVQLTTRIMDRHGSSAGVIQTHASRIRARISD
ncbi:MAG: cation:proton antiporter [Pseudomonadota bacterium]